MVCIPTQAVVELPNSNGSCDTLTVRRCLSIAGVDIAPVPVLTPGSIPFAAATGVLTENNPNWFWKDATLQLGVGTNNPGASVSGAADCIAHFTRLGTPNNAIVYVEGGTALDAGVALFTDTLNEDACWFLDQSDARKLKLALGSVISDANRLTNTKVTVQQDGNFGIGATPTNTRLHVAANNTNDIARIQSLAGNGFSFIAYLDEASVRKLELGYSNNVDRVMRNNLSGQVGIAEASVSADIIETIVNPLTDGYAGIGFGNVTGTAAVLASIGHANNNVGLAFARNKHFLTSVDNNDWMFINTTRAQFTVGMTAGRSYWQMSQGAAELGVLALGGTCKFVYDEGTNQVKVSKNGGAYAVLI